MLFTCSLLVKVTCSTIALQKHTAPKTSCFADLFKVGRRKKGKKKKKKVEKRGKKGRRIRRRGGHEDSAFVLILIRRREKKAIPGPEGGQKSHKYRINFSRQNAALGRKKNIFKKTSFQCP